MYDVSVVLPVYNENSLFLKECLLSLINQSHKNIQIIIIHDDALDSMVINNFVKLDGRILYIKNKQRLGLIDSLNLGINMAVGKYIARMDSDDICHVDRLKKQFIFLEKNTDIDVLGTNIAFIDENSKLIGTTVYPEKYKDIINHFNYTVPLAHPSLMIRKDVYVKYGFYSKQFKYCEDLDLWLRWINQGVKFHNLQDQLLQYRFISSGRRPIKHWCYNVLARLKNFNGNYKYSKIIGILGVLMYILMPLKVKLKIYSMVKKCN